MKRVHVNREEKEVPTNLVLQLLLKNTVVRCFELDQEKKVNR